MTPQDMQSLAMRHASLLAGSPERRFPSELRALVAQVETIYQEIAEHMAAGVPGTRAEEWLLDNRHLIEEALEDIRDNLSPGFVRGLPRVPGLDGASRVIRVHDLATALARTVDKPLDIGWLEDAVEAYQSHVVLTIGELWALSAYLRLAIVRGLVHDACVCLRLETAPEETGDDDAGVAEIAGAVISLRLLATHDWRMSFERLSHVERVLREDPAGAYPRMDFGSRNQYRGVIETLALGSGQSEVEIARRVIERCREACAEDTAPNEMKGRVMHVGHHLLGGGRAALERDLAFTPPLRDRLLRLAYRRPDWIYFGLLGAFTLPLLALIVLLPAQAGAHAGILAGLGLLAAIPLIGLAVAMLNGLVTWRLPPRRLVRMAFETGIPGDSRSVVVVPVLLTGRDDVDQVFARLEINHLNNDDPNLTFVVLGDLADADERIKPEDHALLAHAVDTVQALNRSHGQGPEDGPFLFLNRHRQWNAAERCWMGWERKRGKLVEFHHLLARLAERALAAVDESERGDTAYLSCVGDLTRLRDTRFIITLDADTLMPPDTARRLVGVMAHPLSNAVPAGTPGLLRNGYSILQPRLETDPDSIQTTRFTRVFAGDSGLDLYTHAVSDVYHDLFGQGIYAGKGIYDWRAFEYVLADRIPDNTLLSHDLIEGVHARAGLLSDVVLLEQFPPNAVAFMRRLHRWVRGDWQLLPWLQRRVRQADGTRQPNPLPLIHQWKIVDNLRRSLQPPAVLALLLLAWSGGLPGPVWLWTLLFAGLLASPLISELFDIAGRGLANPAALPQRLRTAPASLGQRLEHWLLNLTLLPYQSYVLLDAITRTLYRLLISRRHLLEWVTAARTQQRLGTATSAFFLWREMWVSPALAVLAAGGIVAVNPYALPAAAPLLLAWLAAPWVIRRYHLVPRLRLQPLNDEARRRLRGIARRTWLFFDHFTGPDDNWLTPDSFQEEPRMALARRTSPTNLGMALTSALAACDLGYLDATTLTGWLRNTLERMHELPRYRGHWLNWYSTRDMQPLEPRYVSTVDSGNLAVCLLTLARGLEAMAAVPMTGARLFDGLVDTLRVLEDTVPMGMGVALREQIARLCRELEDGGDDPGQRQACLEQLENRQLPVLSQELLRMLDEHETIISGETLTQLRTWLGELQRQVGKARRHLVAVQAGADTNGLRDELQAIARLADQAVEDMDFRFLYDRNRHLFHIGYNVSGGTLDPNYYDLLASEARLASFLAIAKGDVPVKHWMRLDRPFRRKGRDTVLMSWGGTLFEYLMPPLFMATDDDSLLGRACRTAIAVHQDFARGHNLPWGISESGYYQMDEQQQYQYRAFGVPGLGFRRDLGDRLVIAPYASMMALAFDAPAVLDNLDQLEAYHAVGLYGLFEAIDFGRTDKAGHRRARVVRSYMSHHQGMALLAIDNLLNGNPMVQRFHADPRIRGVAMLLHERLPPKPPRLKAGKRPQRGTPFKIEAGPRSEAVSTSATLQPRYNVLSNGHYSLFVNSRGGGGALWDGIAITRWQADATTDDQGAWFYIKDLDSRETFSLTPGPSGTAAENCSATFGPHAVEFQRRQHQLLCRMNVAVSSQHDIEARKLVIRNDGNRPRRLLITTYAELAMATAAEFERHPAFSRLFVESECLQDDATLLFRRRPRSSLEKPLYVAHTVLAAPGLQYRFGWETERQRFIGRGRDLVAPRALDGDAGDFAGTTGAVLDAVIGSAIELTVPAFGQAEIGWLTAVARSRKTVLANLYAYRSMPRVDWIFEQAYMQTGQELHNLGIAPDSVDQMMALFSAALVPARTQRRIVAGCSPGTPIQLALWARGISGDRPIVLVQVRTTQDAAMLEPLLQAHTFWSGRQAAVDLVLIDDSSTGYLQEARDRLRDRVAGVRSRTNRHLTGAVVIVVGRDLDPDERRLILAAAHLVLDTGEGAFSRQLLTQQVHDALPPFVPVPSAERATLRTTVLARPENLLFDNGIGGFEPHGREYTMHFDPADLPPAPWANILANPDFGSLVTESGGGYTWADNSAEQRLTPWTNDPVTDAGGEVLYLRDEETGEVWTATARPLSADAPCQVTHGAGYSEFRQNSHGLQHTLRVHVDPEHPVKLSRLTLTNTSAWTRRITITSYAEWVLGTTRAQNAAHITAGRDDETGTLLAHNRFNRLAGSDTAFLGASRAAHGVTTDRTEFLGQGGDTGRGGRVPAALRRIGLSDSILPDGDPCAAYQVHLNLPPGEEIATHFVLGRGRDREHALTLARRFRQDSELEASWQRLQRHWDSLLDVIQVTTPEPAMDLLLNRWLLYQTLSSRLWARGGFYQPGGAYGFRDQLQDVMALIWSAPQQVREHILRAAARQFDDGDVLHWWHEAPLRGVRTRCSDDLVWLPYVTAYYLECTGDTAILEEAVPYLEGAPLESDENERYREFAPGERSDTLYQHCCRALERAGAVGPHGLPIIGSGDWNDGLNRVSTTGRGESVWLAWFLVRVYNDFAPWCEHLQDHARAQHYRHLAENLLQRVEETAWDGAWYRRAYFDDGEPLGSSENEECSMDLIAQVWSVLAVEQPSVRAGQAMQAVWRHLVREDERLVLLLAPPFDRTSRDPGYIKGYPPGIRENGAQYTHAATWAVWAAARLGDGDGAMQLFRLLNPILRTTRREDAERYRVEPYVLAGDVYSRAPHTGRGGWSWYSGAAGWLYRAGIEALLGLKLRAGHLEITPCLPADWDGYQARLRRGAAVYNIRVEKPRGARHGRVVITLDGKTLDGARVPLEDDGGTHDVSVRITG